MWKNQIGVSQQCNVKCYIVASTKTNLKTGLHLNGTISLFKSVFYKVSCPLEQTKT